MIVISQSQLGSIFLVCLCFSLRRERMSENNGRRERERERERETDRQTDRQTKTETER